jgi:hypothetical protein
MEKIIEKQILKEELMASLQERSGSMLLRNDLKRRAKRHFF